MNKYRRLFNDTLIYGLGNFLSKLIMVLLIPLYTKELNAAQFAYVDLLTNLLELLYPILTFSIADAVFRYIIDKEKDTITTFINGFYVLLFGNFLLIPTLFIINYFYPLENFLVLILLFLSNSLKSFFSQFTRGIGKSSLFAVTGILNALFLLIFNFILLSHFHLGVLGYLISIVYSNLIATLILFYKANIYVYFRKIIFRPTVIFDMLKYSVPLIPNTLSWWFVNIFSRYVVMYFHGASITGLLSAAARIAGIINLLSQIFQQAWQYSSAVEFSSDDRNIFFSNVFRYYSLLLIFFGSLAISFSPLIVKYFLNTSYSRAIEFIPFLFLSAIIGAYCYFFSSLYMANMESKVIMHSTLIGAIINIVLTVIMVRTIAIGAVISIFISNCVILYIRVKRLNFIKINYNFSSWISSLIVLTLQALLWTKEEKNHLWSFVFIIVLGIINYKGIATILKFFSRYFKKL